jgi:pimeloyl-ACP methyl ester carboxylesterase
MKKVHVMLIVSLGLIFCGSLLAFFVQIGFGQFIVKEVRVPTSEGPVLSAQLIIPKGVSAEKPVPGIVTIHGYLNSREMQTSFSIEYARRGYVVLNIDMFGHGRSGTEAADVVAAQSAVRYIASLDFVDARNIGVEGHSKGGYAASIAALRLPQGSIKSVLAIGSGLTWLNYTGMDWDAAMPVNYGTIYGKYDDFGWLMWSESFSNHKNVPGYANYSDAMKKAWGISDPVTPLEWYGSKSANTLRILYMPDEIHIKNHFSNTSAAYAMNFMNETLMGGNPSGLADNDMVWYWKEIGTSISLLGIFIFIFAFGDWILSVGKNRDYTVACSPGRARFSPRFWIMLVLGSALPALTFYGFMNLGVRVLKLSRLFPQETSSSVGFWAFLNGILSLAVFIILFFVFGKKEGADPGEWGFKGQAKHIGRQIILGLLTAGAAYILLCVVNFFFIVDFRSILIGFMPLTLAKFQAMCSYFLFFAVFALCNALALNASYRFEKGGYLKTALFSILANVGGMLVLVIYGYGGMRILGYLPFVQTGWSLRIIQSLSFLVFLPLAGLINTYFYKKTGAIYMGAVITAVLLTYSTVGNTALDFLF